MKQEVLSRRLTELIAGTKQGKVHWKVELQTTEANEEEQKPHETEDGIEWIVDECYVSYCCKYRGEEFCFITYELIKTAGAQVKTSNLVFVPPLGIRYFDLRTLLPSSVETSAVLMEQIHQLWKLLLAMYEADKSSVTLHARSGVLTIEDEPGFER